MKLHRLFLPAAVLTLLGTAGSASATLLTGFVSGNATYEDVGTTTPLLGPSTFSFNLDTTQFLLASTDGVSHSHYTFFQTEDSRLLDIRYTSPGGPRSITEGWGNEIDLRNTAEGQEITFSAGSPHGGFALLTLAGPANAFFSGLDLATIHAGPLDLTRSHGSVNWFFNVNLDHPLAGGFTSPVPEPDTAYFMGAMLLMGAVGRFVSRRKPLRG